LDTYPKEDEVVSDEKLTVQPMVLPDSADALRAFADDWEPRDADPDSPPPDEVPDADDEIADSPRDAD
jgi:hypothetical protein